ncbi:hypothetical protein BGW39_010789 [Mortierella sp. 14UC]|nr:hypothetical protein BGW39_010789 [Mortierella sp. 14UC]
MDTQQLPQHHHQHQHQQQQQQLPTRVVSHWAKSTPEEGIQLIFNKADTDKATAGVRILTSPTSLERPCQWDICLRLASSSSYFTGFASTSKTPATSAASSGARSSTPTATAPPRRTASQPQTPTISTSHHKSATPLLVLTLQRASIRLSTAGHGAMTAGDEGLGSFEAPVNPGRARCDTYRTIYIYSPRLRRDIHVQPINREFWPQTVVFKCEDVTDEDYKYHFQIWLSGSSPRQTDAETDARTNQQKNLLFAMRQDTATCNVQINIKDPPPPLTVQQACLESASGLKKRAVSADEGGAVGHFSGGNYNTHGHHNSSNHDHNTSLSKAPSDKHDMTRSNDSKLQDNQGSNHTTEIIRATFWAHKTILESVPFFSRMLSSGRFKEGQQGSDRIYRISLSSDMFEPGIMDILLDYVYTREPIKDDETMGDEAESIDNNTREHYHHGSKNIYSEDYESMSDSPGMDRHPHPSANVALNLQAAASEPSPPRTHQPQFHHYSQQSNYTRSSSSWSFTPKSSSSAVSQPPPPTSPHIVPYTDRHIRSIRRRLKAEDWFLLYRAAIHMEDPPLQAQALDKIQAQLNVQSALERALTWGPGYPEIKRVVLKYVFDERRAIFGDEDRNQLKPYLWPEIEDQVDVLVEITSKIARQ